MCPVWIGFNVHFEKMPFKSSCFEFEYIIYTLIHWYVISINVYINLCRVNKNCNQKAVGVSVHVCVCVCKYSQFCVDELWDEEHTLQVSFKTYHDSHTKYPKKTTLTTTQNDKDRRRRDFWSVWIFSVAYYAFHMSKKGSNASLVLAQQGGF